MSKISISGNNSGTGTFTIAAPDSDNNRTFDLPDEAGTVLTSATDLEPQVKGSLNATGDAPIYACRCWVNFNGTGTVSIRDSGNVSSITDNGTGQYTVNFTNAMPDANYAAVAASNSGAGAGDKGPYLSETYSTSSLLIQQLNANGSFVDSSNLNLAIFR